MSPSIGSLPPKYRVSVDPDQCMLCNRCVENCAYGAFRRDGDRIRTNSRAVSYTHLTLPTNREV